MNQIGWREAIIKAVREKDEGDDSALNRLAQCLLEADDAKQALRDRGYGWTGLGLLETITQIPHYHEILLANTNEKNTRNEISGSYSLR